MKTKQTKTCKHFCKKQFVPTFEKEYARTHNMIRPLPIASKMMFKVCQDVYCQKNCKGTKNGKWVKSFTKKRKNKLKKLGAISGCRDLGEYSYNF